MTTENAVDSIPVPKFDPPPLFSPNVYIPELNEKKYYGPRGYMNRIEYIVDKSNYPALELAQKYNFVTQWKRRLEVQILEARNIVPQVSCHVLKVRCKVEVGNQIKRTEMVPLQPRSSTMQLNQTLRFTVEEQCNIKLVVYVKKCIVPNSVLGHVTISPNQLVERSTTTNWFPFDTVGELKLSIALSAPEMAPFKFSLATPITLSFRDCHILNARGEKVFTIMGTWPNLISILDANDLSILTIKNKVYEQNEKVFGVYMYGQTKRAVTVTWFNQQGISRIYLEGISSVTQTEYLKRNFAFNLGDTCVSYANYSDKSYNIVIRACPDSLLLLAAVVVIAKFLESDLVR